jgi:hypothetical protein
MMLSLAKLLRMSKDSTRAMMIKLLAVQPTLVLVAVGVLTRVALGAEELSLAQAQLIKLLLKHSIGQLIPLTE